MAYLATMEAVPGWLMFCVWAERRRRTFGEAFAGQGQPRGTTLDIGTLR